MLQPKTVYSDVPDDWEAWKAQEKMMEQPDELATALGMVARGWDL